MNFIKSLWGSTTGGGGDTKNQPNKLDKPRSDMEESAKAALASVTSKFEQSKAKDAVGVIRDSFKELGKELGDSR